MSFLIQYDGYGRTLTMAIYDNAGSLVGTPTGQASYWLPLGQGFTLHRIGAGAWGLSSTNEPKTVASVDNIHFDANMARNGNYEFDSNADNVPDNWQAWIWSKGPVYRSNWRSVRGSWSVRIPDSSTTNDYGLQTVRMAASSGQGYVGTTWVYADPGAFTMCIEFWDSFSSGNRLAVACKSSSYTYQWEFLDLTVIAPMGTVAIDLLVYSSGGNTGTGYFDLAELRLRRSSWSVNNHDGDAGIGLTGWITTFFRAAELGVSFVRTALVWNAFEWQGDELWDQSAIDYWRSIVRAGKAHGIDFIAILNGPKPSWVTDANKYIEFREFCRKMGQTFGPDIYYYQVLNEHNNGLVRTIDGNLPDFAWNCYWGLRDGESTTDAGHESGFKSIVNIYANQLYWAEDLRSWLGSAGPAIDIAAIDHYPATYTLSGCDDWSPLDALFQIMKDYSKEGAIMETGYSTSYDPDQENWVNCALPLILAKEDAHNRANPTVSLILNSWYELVDQNTGGWWPLDLFGLLKSSQYGYAPRMAYDDFRYRVSLWKF